MKITWQQIGPNNAFNNDIRAITEFEDELWVGGDFSNVGGCTSCDGVVKWDGSAWVGGNSGVDLSGGVDTTVRVLYVSPTDGRLYMGGHFRGLTPNGVYNANLNGVAAYDGSNWFALDEGVGDNPDDYVRAISEYNGKIVVGGYFTSASGISANKIARFNLTTQTWSPMGQGFNGVGVDEYVKSAAVWNGIFFAGGAYTIAESGPMNYIAQWYEPPIAQPIASINQQQYTACSGSCVAFSDNSTYNPTSWNWSFPGGSITSSTLQNPPNICYSTPGTYTVTLQACNNSGCNTTTASITISSAPVLTVNNPTICSGSSAVLTANSSVQGGSFLWSPGGQTTSSITVSPAATTNYTVTYNSSSCGSTTATGTVTVSSTTPTVTVNNATVCSGSATTLTAQASVSGGTYSWYPDGQSTPTITVSPTNTSTYTVTYSVGSCSSNPANSTVTVNQAPTVNAGSDQWICAGQTVTLGGTGANTYSWSNSVINDVAFSPTSTQTYTVTGTDAAGCSGTDQVVVTVNSVPTVNAGSDQSICTGQSVTLSGNGANSYSWSNGITNGVAFSPTATQTYTVTGTDAAGCTGTDQVVVTVNPTPTVNAGNDLSICSGQSVTFSGSGANSYSWSNGITNGVAFSPTATQTYTVTGTDAAGCTGTDQVVVTVNPSPSVNAGSDQSICAGQSVTLSGSGANSYSWSNGITNGVAFSPISTQTYTVTGTNTLGCSGTDQVIVIVGQEISVTLNESAYDTYSLNGQTYSQSGTYIQTLTSSNGCDSIITLNLTLSFTGIDQEELMEIILYPNPTTNQITIHANESFIGKEYSIFDQIGKIVNKGRLTNSNTTLSLTGFSNGIYCLQIEGHRRKTFVVQKD